MKKSVFTACTGILVGLVISTTAKGQIAFSEMQSRKAVPFYLRSNKESVFNPTYHNNISIRAIRHFLVNFDEVFNEEWYCTTDMFVAMFRLNDIGYRVDYNKKGNWIETFRTYDETKLPSDLRQSVEGEYPDYHIFLVQEIEQPLHAVTYIVHLEGKTKLINLRVCNGVIEEWQNFDKSK